MFDDSSLSTTGRFFDDESTLIESSDSSANMSTLNFKMSEAIQNFNLHTL
jgi:hypothetical protein